MALLMQLNKARCLCNTQLQMSYQILTFYHKRSKAKVKNWPKKPQSILTDMLMNKDNGASETNNVIANELNAFEDDKEFFKTVDIKLENIEKKLKNIYEQNVPQIKECSKEVFDDLDQAKEELDSEFENIQSFDSEFGKYVENLMLDDHFVKKIKSKQRKLEAANYGTPDPSVPISHHPCCGCGAFLNCQDPGLPGYLPSEKYSIISDDEFKTTLCQRCFLIRKYDYALNVKVNPKEFENIIRNIRDKKAAVVVLVDLTDITNSTIRNLTKFIGNKHHIYIVGNKIDLIPRDGKGFFQRIKDSLIQVSRNAVISEKNVKYIGLMSAKTGYGVEELVNKLMNHWERKGDVYLVGTTNTGKSTLFNALLSSDYCKHVARDFIHRATTSVWPGTTLNTLKFPIVTPTSFRLYERTKRLQDRRKEEVEARRIDEERRIFEERKKPKFESLIGHIGTTYGKEKEFKPDTISIGFDPKLASYVLEPEGDVHESGRSREAVNKESLIEVNYNEELFEKSHWCYDTPGVINPEQTINLMTQEELATLILGKAILFPRTFVMRPNQTMFVSGAGRIEYLEGENNALFTVLSALKVYVMDTKEADEFYINKLNSGRFEVPCGDRRRIGLFPSLVGKELSMFTKGWRESCGDIILSSAGWVGVTSKSATPLKFRAYTPGASGLHLRTPSLLPFAVNLRGPRERGSARYVVKR